MGTPAQIKSGIKTRLATISGLRAYARRPNRVLPPCAWPELVDGRRATFGGATDWTVDVYLVVPSQKSVEVADQLLEPYAATAGASSVPAAIDGDGTLGGGADGVRDVALTEYGTIETPDGVQRTGAVWRLEVLG